MSLSSLFHELDYSFHFITSSKWTVESILHRPLGGLGLTKPRTQTHTDTHTHTHEGTAELSLVRGKCNHKGFIIQTQNTHTH